MDDKKPQVDLSKMLVKQRAVEIPSSTEVKTSLKWRAVRLHKIIRANGSSFLPNKEGIYEPKTLEEKDLVAYFAEQSYPYLEAVWS